MATLMMPVELFQREENLRAVRPRAGIGDIEVIAPGLGRKAGRTVGGDAVAEHAVHALEIAGFADLLTGSSSRHWPSTSIPITQPPRGPAPPPGGSPRCLHDTIPAVRSLNTAEPATSALAPARATSGAFSGVMPPSISMSIGRPPASARTLRSFSTALGMNFWPPKPGLTDMTRIEIDEIDHRLDASRPACRG